MTAIVLVQRTLYVLCLLLMCRGLLALASLIIHDEVRQGPWWFVGSLAMLGCALLLSHVIGDEPAL